MTDLERRQILADLDHFMVQQEARLSAEVTPVIRNPQGMSLATTWGTGRIALPYERLENAETARYPTEERRGFTKLFKRGRKWHRNMHT